MADQNIQLKNKSGGKLFPAVNMSGAPNHIRYKLGNINNLKGASSSTILAILGTPAALKLAIDNGAQIVAVVSGVWQCTCVNASYTGATYCLTFLDAGQISSSPIYVKRYICNASGTAAWASCQLQQAKLDYAAATSLEEETT